MLRLLLDEHVSPKVARGLRRRRPDVLVRYMSEWEQGGFLGQPDALCLQAAALQRLTLVTYDCRTIPTLLKTWAEEGRSHAGVVFIDEKTIASGNISSLVRALNELCKEAGDWDWTNRVCFLQA
ncbi:MAG TPA: DUF5615 family PIN-like protein [Candidatus Angelobacter sp.]